MILIRYADPPTIIIFSIGEITYTLYYNPNDRFQYSVSEGSDSPIKLTNINEWLGLRTRGRYNLEILHDLANSFIVGKNTAYTQDDLSKCAGYAFELTRDMLFKDGLAGRYVELFDIECMSLEQIKKSLHCAQDVGMAGDRIRRFRHVCERNGWADLAHAWGLLLRDEQKSENSVLVLPNIDDTIKRSIGRMVAGTYTKERDYLNTLTVVSDGKARTIPRPV